jgi:hypothetical protein
MCFFFCFIGMKMSVDGVLRGAGDMQMFTIANLVNLGLRVSLAMALAPPLRPPLRLVRRPPGLAGQFPAFWLGISARKVEGKENRSVDQMNSWKGSVRFRQRLASFLPSIDYYAQNSGSQDQPNG